MKEEIYQIFCGDLEDEFYTFELPCIEQTQVICYDLIKKGVIGEEILGTKIEEFFKIDVSDLVKKGDKSSKTFDLTLGFVVKLIKISELNWIDKDQKSAEELLKDKKLRYYQSLVPSLVEKVQKMQEHLSHMNTNGRKNNLLIND